MCRAGGIISRKTWCSIDSSFPHVFSREHPSTCTPTTGELQSHHVNPVLHFSCLPPWRNVMQWFPNPLTLTPCLPLLPPPSPPPPSASARFEVISYSSLSSRSFKTCSTHSLHVAASVKFPEFLVHSAHMRCRYPTQCPPKCWGKHLQSWSLCCVLFSLHGLPRREGMDIAALPRSALTPLSLRPSHFFPSLTEHSKLSWSQLVSVLHWTI